MSILTRWVAILPPGCQISGSTATRGADFGKAFQMMHVKWAFLGTIDHGEFNKIENGTNFGDSTRRLHPYEQIVISKTMPV